MTTSRLIYCLAVLVSAGSLLVASRVEGGEFAHLLDQLEGTTPRRLHLISEVVHANRRVQVEEYLELDSYRQLIQLKWHTPAASKQRRLNTRKMNVLILNSAESKQAASVMYQYEPFECGSITLGDQNHLEGNSSWADDSLVGRVVNDLDDAGEVAAARRLAKSLVSTALDSPYLAQVRVGPSKQRKWVAGVAGLWLSAQFADEQPKRATRMVAGRAVPSETEWRLERPNEGLEVDFFMGAPPQQVGRRAGGSNSTFEAPELVLIRRRRQHSEHDQHNQTTNTTAASEEHLEQRVNVFQLELNFADRLAANLFSLPVGFDCPGNAQLSPNGLYVRDSAASQLLGFELVASRTRTAARPLVEVRQIEWVRVRHPMNASLALTSFSEGRSSRCVQDHFRGLEFRMVQLGGVAGQQRQCFVEQLEFDSRAGGATCELPEVGSSSPPTTNPNFVRLEDAAKLQLDLSEFHLSFLLGETGSPDLKKMRLLNRFDVSPTRSELVFEAAVPAEHLAMLVDLTGALDFAQTEMRVVRVYEQQLALSSLDGKTRIRRGLLKLLRVLLLVFEARGPRRVRKLVEIRLNLVEDQQLVSYTRRAQMFDLSACYDLAEESMELIVSYEAEPGLLEFAEGHANELLERFYGSAQDWLGGGVPAGTPQAGPEGATAAPLEVLQKRRLGASLNFLRVPRLELRSSLTGELELHLTILDRISPLVAFEQVANASFVGLPGTGGPGFGENSAATDDDDERLVAANSARECANLCRLFACRVFAFERDGGASGACRLSGRAFARVRLVARAGSELHFERPSPDHRRGLDEASLAELSAHIERISAELDAADEEEDATAEAVGPGPQEDHAGFTMRHRRQAAPERQPLFSFDFVDRSGAGEYAPPIVRRLEPAGLSVRRLPLVLNLARDGESSADFGSQMARASRDFEVRLTGRAYRLEALEGGAPEGGGAGPRNDLTDEHQDEDEDDERTFRDLRNELYFTLRRVASLSRDNCALLCANVHEQGPSETSTNGRPAEQTCVEFSYEPLGELDGGGGECVLLVRTDFRFVSGLLELVREGERVLELGSPDELLVASPGGVVASRRAGPTDPKGPGRSPPNPTSGDHFEHSSLTFGFAILYLLACAGLLGLVLHLRRPAAPQAHVAFAMSEINGAARVR